MASVDPNLYRTIPALPAAQTPLSGTELVPISQNGVTVQATVSQIGGGAGTTINGLAGAVELLAGSNISLSQSGQNITINSTGGGGTITGSGEPNQVAGQLRCEHKLRLRSPDVHGVQQLDRVR